MAVNRIQFFAPTGPHLKAPSLERRFFFASALFYLHSILRLMRNGELTATPHSDHLTAFLGQDRDVPIIRADRGISAAEQFIQCCGEPDMSIINGLITNDKFCLTRTGQLQLSWPRARHRLQRAVVPQLPDEVTHQGGQHARAAATRLARSAHQRADAHRPAALGPGVSAPSAVGDDLLGPDPGTGVPNPAGGLPCE